MPQLTLAIPVPAPAGPELATLAQLKYISTLRIERGLAPLTDAISKRDASKEIDTLKALPKATALKLAAPGAGRLADVPCSNYALEIEGVLRFYRVKVYKGTRYLRQLVGHPGAWATFKLSYSDQAQVITRLASSSKEAAKRYADEYTCCAVCASPLSDETSRARGIGPVCWARFV